MNPYTFTFLIMVIPFIFLASMSMLGVYYYFQPLNNNIDKNINSILDSTLPNNYNLTQQQRIDLLIKNHAISITQQEKITAMESEQINNMNRYAFLPFLSLLWCVFIVPVAHKLGWFIEA